MFAEVLGDWIENSEVLLILKQDYCFFEALVGFVVLKLARPHALGVFSL